MVFQNYALYPHMSVFDNMAYGLKIAKVPMAEIKARVDKAAKILELGALLERKPRELSGGQRQRVAMGRAIVRQPQVFLFDEPLSNLDAKLRAQTRLEIQKLHRELGITSLFVTHDQVEAMTLAQRMIVMNAGRDGADRHARGGLRAAGHHLRRRLHRLAADEPAARPAPMARASRVGGQTLPLPAAGAARRRADARPAARARRAAPTAARLAAAGRDGRDARRRAARLRPPRRRRCSRVRIDAHAGAAEGRRHACRCTCRAEHLHWFDAGDAAQRG